MNRLVKHGASRLASLVVLACAAGCGVIAHGTTQRVAIVSEPPGAHVSINGKDYGDTPLTAVLDRRTEHTVVVMPEDGMPAMVKIRQRRNYSAIAKDWAWIFTAYLGPPPILIDFLTGGAYSLHPEQVQVWLRPRAGKEYSQTPIFGGSRADAKEDSAEGGQGRIDAAAGDRVGEVVPADVQLSVDGLLSVRTGVPRYTTVEAGQLDASRLAILGEVFGVPAAEIRRFRWSPSAAPAGHPHEGTVAYTIWRVGSADRAGITLRVSRSGMAIESPQD